MFYSNNPVLDAEKESERQEELAERPHIECEMCHGYLYKEDDYYEADDVIELDGIMMCEYCARAYLDKKGGRLHNGFDV